MTNNLQMIEKCKDMQKLYENVLEDTKKLQELQEKITIFKSHSDELSDFYHEDWAECVEALKSDEVNFSILSQDNIYEALIEQYETTKKLLFECSKYIL